MPTTEEILDAAKKIGQMVTEHDAAQKLEAAIKALDNDADAKQSMGAFNQHLQALAAKEASGQPIEVEDKRTLETLQQAVVMNIHLRNFQTAQMDYVDLLRKIDEQITGEPAGGADLSAPGSPAPGVGLGPGIIQ